MISIVTTKWHLFYSCGMTSLLVLLLKRNRWHKIKCGSRSVIEPRSPVFIEDEGAGEWGYKAGGCVIFIVVHRCNCTSLSSSVQKEVLLSLLFQKLIILILVELYLIVIILVHYLLMKLLSIADITCSTTVQLTVLIAETSTQRSPMLARLMVTHYWDSAAFVCGHGNASLVLLLCENAWDDPRSLILLSPPTLNVFTNLAYQTTLLLQEHKVVEGTGYLLLMMMLSWCTRIKCFHHCGLFLIRLLSLLSIKGCCTSSQSCSLHSLGERRLHGSVAKQRSLHLLGCGLKCRV